MRRLLAGLALLTLAACGSDATAPKLTAAGSWSGSSSGVAMTMTLVDNNGAVSGNGQINGPGGAVAFTVTGTFVQPALSANLTATGFQDINFTASLVNSTQFVGSLNGSGFQNQAIVLNKQ